MKRDLKRFDLDFNLVCERIKDNFKAANTLSVELLKIINSSKGVFFTYFTPDVNEQMIYQLQYSILSCAINKKELIQFILSFLEKNPNLTCVFEDVLRYPVEIKDDNSFDKYGAFYNNEVYYIVNGEYTDYNIIEDGLFACNAIWHSLCVLSKAIIVLNKSRQLSINEIETVVRDTQLAIIGAYDDEGYIFWERCR